MSDNTLNTVIEKLMEAKAAALFNNSSFGFADDRLIVVKEHRTLLDYQPQHPTDYIKGKLRSHHRSWIVDPIERSIELLHGLKYAGIDEAIKILEDAKSSS